jgi:hypothetical protein
MEPNICVLISTKGILSHSIVYIHVRAPEYISVKEILEYPLLPPWVKIKRPCNFFFTFFSASMQQNDLMNCTGM